MACNCEIYECLEVIGSDCDGITVDLPIDESGVWRMEYEFNGRWFKEDIEVVDGESVVLPPIFNENYTHLMKFYNPDGELLENTCYKLDMSAVASYSPAQYSPVVNDVLFYQYKVVASPSDDMILLNGIWTKEIEAGNTITDNRLAGKVATGVVAMSQSYNSGDYDKAKQESTLTMTNGVSFGEDTVITIYVA